MPNLDNAFGIHELALKLQARRTEILSANMANADTPGYKARDIDFKAELERFANDGPGPSQAGVRVTNARHMAPADAGPGGRPLYRNPMQPSVDGNTVDAQQEKAAFMENALRYQSTLTFVNGKIQALKKALGGQ